MEDEDYGYCEACAGSGEGMADGTVCYLCNGSGEGERQEDESYFWQIVEDRGYQD